MHPDDPGHGFAVDAMLGRLARWLRVLGHDVLFDPTLDDATLVARAAAEERVLLTRDRHLLRDLRPARALEIRDDAPLDQLRTVVHALSLPPPAELFTRCLVCNTPLSAPLAAEEAAAVVPPSARELAGTVRRCSGCGRVYWNGSHVRRMQRSLRRALPEWIGGPDGA
jgi:uncharacterized protein